MVVRWRKGVDDEDVRQIFYEPVEGFDMLIENSTVPCWMFGVEVTGYNRL